MKLWYDKPAQEWLEALPIGNGTLAAMVFGGVEQETLALNHGDLWAGAPHDYANPDGLKALPEIRRLVFAGEHAAAQALVQEQFLGQPVRQKPYQALGELLLSVQPPTAAGTELTSYHRELDLEEATVKVHYTQGGVEFTREILASQPDGLIVLRLSASAPMLLHLALRSPHPQESRASGRTLILGGRSETVFFGEAPRLRL